jgi:N12 class adenine-specific DNA methylase
VSALTSVLPPKLEAGDISARIGVSWVDVEDYQALTALSLMKRTITRTVLWFQK